MRKCSWKRRLMESGWCTSPQSYWKNWVIKITYKYQLKRAQINSQWVFKYLSPCYQQLQTKHLRYSLMNTKRCTHSKPREFLLAFGTGVRFISLSQPLVAVILIILINVFLIAENSAVSLLLTSEARIMIPLFYLSRLCWKIMSVRVWWALARLQPCQGVKILRIIRH